MEVFTAASHHDVLMLIFQIALLLFTARILGELAQRLGQPAVVGEILAGIVLGPSLLSGLIPALGVWIVPQTAVQGYLLEVVSLLGVMFLLLITGLETDLGLIRRHAKTAIGVSYGGITVTFVTGFALGMLLPDFLLADADERLVFALFVATAMSISAIPVIAKVLMDLNLMRRDIGQTIIAAGMSDDTNGWILLSIVAGLASGEAITAGTVLQTIGTVLGFLLLSFTAGRWVVKRVLAYVQDEAVSEFRLLTLVVVFTFAWGAISQALHLEALLGAFIMGIIFGTIPRLPEGVHHMLEAIALGVFAPIFFAVAGLKVNIINLLDPLLIAIALLVIFIASAGKVVGTYIGGRFVGGRDHWTALSFGAGLNARGAMEIVIATIGLQLGILSQDMFSIIVIMAMATSLMAPPALRWVLDRVEPEQQELDRLRQEALAERNMVANIHRVLLPLRLRNGATRSVETVEANVLKNISQSTDLSITLLTITSSEEKNKGSTFLQDLGERLYKGQEVLRKVETGGEPAQIILDEVEKDYDLLVMGASGKEKSDILFTPLVDYVVRMSPIPTMIVHGPRTLDDWSPRRLLVPTNGTEAAKRAADVAFSIAGPEDAEVIILHVVSEQHSAWRYREGARADWLEHQLEIGHQIVNEVRELGESFDVWTTSTVRVGPDPETVILDIAEKNQIDLIVLGTAIRPGSDRLFLGPRVENVLQHTPCPVIVINSSGSSTKV